MPGVLSGAERSRPITFASINVSSRKASANRPPKASSSGGRVYGRLFSSRSLGSSPSRSMCSHFVHRLPSRTSEAGGRCVNRQQANAMGFALCALEVSAGS